MSTIDCHKCKHCQVINDPDPDDWFNDDDQSIVCTAMKEDKKKYKYISSSNRPYQINREFKTMAKVWKARRPTWCPGFEEGVSKLKKY